MGLPEEEAFVLQDRHLPVRVHAEHVGAPLLPLLEIDDLEIELHVEVESGHQRAAERGRGGGYALDRTYSLPPVNFTAREAALLVAVGRHAIDMRLLPFTDTLESGLDKVRAALSTSAQREMLARFGELSFLGVPALPSNKAVRATIERAWFEQQPLRITYVDGDFVQTTRAIRIHGVVMERHETRIDAADLETGKRRHFRLDRIQHAEVLCAL